MLLLENTVPMACFAVYPSDKRMVTIIKRGESGYWCSHREDTELAAQRYVDSQNRALHVSDLEREAMQIGSMFGWHVPGANAALLKLQSQRAGEAVGAAAAGCAGVGTTAGLVGT